MTATPHETARLTADIVVLADDHDDVTHVLLIRRRWEPFADMWALPGGHVDAGEGTEIAARRELREETGIDPGHLDLVSVYAEPGRDPRGRYATWAYRTHMARLVPPTAGTDAAAAQWVSVRQAIADGLAFDHAKILIDALG